MYVCGNFVVNIVAQKKSLDKESHMQYVDLPYQMQKAYCFW